MMATDDLVSSDTLPAPASPPITFLKPPTAVSTKDPWENWNPEWTARPRRGKTALTVHDLQEKREPTEGYTPPQERGAPPATRVQRRILDARLWAAMTLAQQRAAFQIVAAYEVLARGLGYSGSNWERVGRSSHAGAVTDAQIAMMEAYMTWARKCAVERISHAMITDVLIAGHSCRVVDKQRRMRTGSAKQNLLKGLSLYCQLKGWR